MHSTIQSLLFPRGYFSQPYTVEVISQSQLDIKGLKNLIRNGDI
jgi:hypothetical protein